MVLGHAFGVPGITVDTHVARLVTRWGLTAHTDPVKIEAELNTQLPRAQWTLFSDRTIFHGRRVCHAKKPACGACFLAPLCPAYGTGGGVVEPEAAAALVVGAGARPPAGDGRADGWWTASGSPDGSTSPHRR